MKKVAFICVHNSCRSQMAEALGRIFAADTFESFSAGTAPKENINSDAVFILKKLYNVDIAKTQYPKLLSDLPEIDIIITMGCNVQCPSIPCKFREDWGLNDPTGKGEAEFVKTAETIERK